MIVIKSRYRKKGYGIGNLFTKALFKKTIKNVTSSSLAQKVANAAVNGAVSATEEIVKNAVKRPFQNNKKKTTTTDTLSKKQRIDKIINECEGSGIVLD